MPAEEPSEQRRSFSARFGIASDELRTRLVSGVVIAVLAFIMVWWSPKVFAVLTFFIAAAMSWEWGRIVRGPGSDIGTVVHILAVLVAAVLSATGLAGLGVAAAFIGAIAVATLVFGSGRSQLSGAGVLYTALPVVALGWLRGDEPLGFDAVLVVLLMVAVTDVAAFFSGRSIGGPKLWPAVSPKKTWSGLIGGVLAATIVGALFAKLSGTGSAQWLASLGCIMGLVAQGGDLAESALKRHFDLKDASGLIPGHGGFMDRMDGIVTASIAAALIAFAIDAFAPARALLYGS
jgi:phosphatidate cytidylyltransferase